MLGCAHGFGVKGERDCGEVGDGGKSKLMRMRWGLWLEGARLDIVVVEIEGGRTQANQYA